MDLVLETANKMCYSRHPRRGDNRGSPSTQTGEVGHHAPYAWEIESRDLVIIPSMSFAPKELTTIEGIAHYEERALYAIFGLSDPNTRLIIVTSTPLDEWIVKYHFSLLPSRKRENCRSRVQFYNVGDASPTRCLTEKILDRPRLLSRLKQDATTMTNGKRPQRTLLVYRSTVHEENLSKLLGLPYYSARPEFAIHGTKPGSRKIFRDLGIPCADGTYEAERNLKAFQKSIWKVLRKNPHAKKAVVKVGFGVWTSNYRFFFFFLQFSIAHIFYFAHFDKAGGWIFGDWQCHNGSKIDPESIVSNKREYSRHR